MFGGGDDPFRDIESFFKKMSQLGSGPFIHTGSSSSSGSSSFSRTMGNGGTFESMSRGSFSPAATVADNGSQFLIDIDVPGCSKEEMKVTATSSKLCISGQRRPTVNVPNSMQQQDFFGGNNNNNSQNNTTTGNGNGNNSSLQQQFQQLLMDERPVGFFERCFTFPQKIEESNISAQFNNGVLSVAVGHGGGRDDGSKEIDIR